MKHLSQTQKFEQRDATCGLNMPNDFGYCKNSIKMGMYAILAPAVSPQENKQQVGQVFDMPKQVEGFFARVLTEIKVGDGGVFVRVE